MRKISEKISLEDLIGIIVSHLENRNISVVLVGGAAVSWLGFIIRMIDSV